MIAARTKRQDRIETSLPLRRPEVQGIQGTRLPEAGSHEAQSPDVRVVTNATLAQASARSEVHMRPKFDRDGRIAEKGIRFGCGVLFGVPLGFWLLMRWLEDVMQSSSVAFVSGIALVALLCGALAVRYGERFWHRLAALIPWM
jgi:hypothetical protein